MTEQLVRGLASPFAKRLSAITPVEWRWISIASLISVCSSLEVAKLLGLPAEPGFTGSLLSGPSPVLAILDTFLVGVVCAIVGAIAILLIADEAGMLCACIGLSGLAVRGGSIRSVLQLANGNGIFGLLAVESVFLFGLICLFWIALRLFSALIRGKNVSDFKYTAPNETETAGISEKISVAAVEVLVMAVCEIVLIQSDAKSQSMIGVGLAGFGASIAAYVYKPLADGFWYWIGPSLLAVTAYSLAMLNGEGIEVGEVHGWFAALVRPTPLDYASLGTAGALLGYWSSRRWAQPEEEIDDNETPIDPAPSPTA